MQRNYQEKKRSGTLSNILYLLLSFPLGTLYFIVIITGLSVGLSTIIIWVGIPILLLTLAAIWGMATLERALAVNLLKVDIPLGPLRAQEQRNWRGWFSARVRDPLTWKSLIFLVIKFPLGIVSFTLALALPLLAFGFLLEPLVYLLNMTIMSMAVAHSSSWIPFVGFISPHFDLFQFARSFIGVPVGVALWLIARYLLNGLAYMSGEFAHVMLSSVEYDVARPKDEYSTYQYQYVNREYMQQAQHQ